LESHRFSSHQSDRTAQIKQCLWSAKSLTFNYTKILGAHTSKSGPDYHESARELIQKYGGWKDCYQRRLADFRRQPDLENQEVAMAQYIW
jgi:hypothetical protein